MPTPTIPVSLSTPEWEILVKSFIESSFLPESVETLHVALEEGQTFEQAVMLTLRNEAANDVLLQVVAKTAVAEITEELQRMDEALGPLDGGLGDFGLDLGSLNLDLGTEFDLQFDPLPEGVTTPDPWPPQWVTGEPVQTPVPPLQPPLTLIWVTFRKEGIHRYPAAGTDPNLASGDEYDVSFLAHPHRHIFHFRVGIQVFHDDRDIEFIQFKRWLEGLYANGTLELNHKSCEMLAEDLHAAIAARYPGRKMTIDISEDGENGATILYFE